MAEVATPTQDTSQTTTGTIQPPSTIVPDQALTAPDPAVRFRGLGTNFKAKLIGIDEVPDSRGDKMCAESLLKLKAAVLASGQHKQKIVVNVSLEGIKIVDILTGEVQHVHPVHRISFIARDLTDRRAFGYVYGAGEGRHQFFGIKTAKVAELLVLALRDLFQVVYDMKKKEMEEKSGEAAKVENGETKQQEDVYAVPHKSERPAPEAAPSMPTQQSQGSLLDLEQQLSNIQAGINNIDSFGPWPQDLPNSPETPFSPGGEESGSDMFGIANLSDISSLSSDFSCASATVPEHIHAAGSEKGGMQPFQRSSSARSAMSWHGKQGRKHESLRASSHSARNYRLGSVPDSPGPTLPEGRELFTKRPEVLAPPPTAKVVAGEAIQRVQTSENGDVGKSEEVFEVKKGVKKMEKTRDTLKSSSSTLSLPTESDKKMKKSTSSGFFSRSKKSKKSKKEKSSFRHKGSKSADEQMSPTPTAKTAHDTSNAVSQARKKPLKKTNSTTFDFARRDSVSSVNSVQSCVVPSTTYSDTKRHLSSSRTSLDNVSKRVAETKSSTSTSTKTSSENLTHNLPSYIVQSSICPRTRPKVKHSERITEAEHNPNNPPMFKTHHDETSEANSANATSNSDDLPTSEKPSNAKKPLTWTASFDADFDSFEKNKRTSKTLDDTVDPFTGLASQDLTIPSSTSANFEETPWGSPDADREAQSNETGSADPFQSDTFANEDSFEFSSDPFSTKQEASPFDGVDPFEDVKMEDPLADPFSVFDDRDSFGDSNVNDMSTIKLTAQENTDSDTLKDFEVVDSDSDNRLREGSDEPTFPHGSEEFTVHLRDLKNVTAVSADSSSLTSGMSSPIVASSPVHGPKTSPSTTSTNTAVAPPLPPRLPPRPHKVTNKEQSEENEQFDECPNIPPPPLPDICPTPPSVEDLDEDFLFDDFDDATLSDDWASDTPPIAPAIPQRSSKSISSSGHSSESEKAKDSLDQQKIPRLPPPPNRAKKRARPGSLRHTESTSSGGPKDGTSDSYSSSSMSSSSLCHSSPSEENESFFTCSSGSGGSGGQPKNTSNYSDDLFVLSTTAVEPAPQPGAKLTTNQILAGFGGMGQQQQNMFPGQPGMMAPPGQPGMMAPPGQFGYQQQAAPGFQQNVSVPYGGMFPSGPSPAIPPRPGAMRPPAPQVVPGGAPQNPFGDAAGMGGGFGGDMLAPVSQAGKQEEEQVKAKADPFSSLIPGMGGAGAVSKKDMFKNFQMAKPPQPPPRTNPPPNTTNGARQAASPENKAKASDFDSYFLNAVGGVPLTEDAESAAPQAPVPAPRGGGDADPFGFGDVAAPATEDPFASNNAFAQPFEFNQSTNGNSQSLFG